MTEAQVVQIMREHLEGQFPKECPNCHRRFESLLDYARQTRPIEPNICYDAEMGNWNPIRPVGTVTYSNCPCGTTLALSSQGMPVFRLWTLYNWARTETRKRGVSMQELLAYLRVEIRKTLFVDEPDPLLMDKPPDPGQPDRT